MPQAAPMSFGSASAEVMLTQRNVPKISLGCGNGSLPVLLVTKLMLVSQERSVREQRPRAV